MLKARVPCSLIGSLRYVYMCGCMYDMYICVYVCMTLYVVSYPYTFTHVYTYMCTHRNQRQGLHVLAVLQCVAVCCSVLQCVVVCCSVL